MNTMAVRWVAGLFVITCWANVASADTLFKNALQEKYDFKIVSCYTCHAKGIDPATGKPFGKEVRNDFGKLFEPALAAKKMNAQLKAIKQAPVAAKPALQATAKKDFLEALIEVEAMKADDGKNYGEKVEAGDIEGVKLKGD